MMTTYTITTSPVEEAGLAAAVAAVNAEIDARNAAALAADPKAPQEPHVTNGDYLTARVADVLTSYALAHKDVVAQTALDAFLNAPAANRAQILDALGMTDYANLPTAALKQALLAVGVPAFLAMPPDKQNQLFTLAGIGP